MGDCFIPLKSDFYEILKSENTYFNPITQEHTHDCIEILYLIDGQIDFMIESASYRLCPGDIAVVQPGARHGVRMHGGTYKRFVLSVNPQCIEALGGGMLLRNFSADGDLLHMKKTDSGVVCTKLMHLWDETMRGDEYSQLYCNALLIQIMVLLSRAMPVKQVRHPTDDDAVARAVAQYIQMHLAGDLQTGRLAELHYVSRYALSRIFMKVYGMTVQQYTQRQRLAMANQLLQNGMHAQLVAESVGYAEYSTFYRAFRRIYGISPTDASKQRPLNIVEPPNRNAMQMLPELVQGQGGYGAGMSTPRGLYMTQRE